MDRWSWLAIAALALSAGCRSTSNQELLERELRWQEDEIYHLQSHLEQFAAEIEGLKKRNAELEKQRGAATTPPPRPFQPSRPSTAPPSSVTPPAVRPPSQRSVPPYSGPPTISPPDVTIPDGDPPRSAPRELAPPVITPPSSNQPGPPNIPFPSDSEVNAPTNRGTSVWPSSAGELPLSAVEHADNGAPPPTAGQRLPPIEPTILPRSHEEAFAANEPTLAEPQSALADPAAPAAEMENFTPPPGYVTAGDRDVTELVVDPAWTRGWDADGRSGHEGIEILIDPRNVQSQSIDEPGSLAIVAIDPLLDGPASKLARWDVPADVAAQHFLRGGDSNGMYFKLRWPNRAPEHRTLIVFVRFTGGDGRQLISEQQVDVDIVTAGRGDWSAGQPTLAPPQPPRVATRPLDGAAPAGGAMPARGPNDDWKRSPIPLRPMPAPEDNQPEREPPALLPHATRTMGATLNPIPTTPIAPQTRTEPPTPAAAPLVAPTVVAPALNNTASGANQAQPAPTTEANGEAPTGTADVPPAAAPAKPIVKRRPQWSPYR